MIRRWFMRLLGRVGRQVDSDLHRRMDEALDRARTETSRLSEDGRELTERIRRNTKTGRTLLGGSRPL